MEDKSITIKTDIYDSLLFNLPVKIHNITNYKQVTLPHRKTITELSCNIYLYGAKIFDLNRHWRPGEILELESKYSESQKDFNGLQKDVLKEFIFYCGACVEFFDENEDFHSKMKDPWCFNTVKILDCFYDFISVYAERLVCFSNLNLLDFQPLLKILERLWLRSFHSSLVLSADS